MENGRSSILKTFVGGFAFLLAYLAYESVLNKLDYNYQRNVEGIVTEVSVPSTQNEDPDLDTIVRPSLKRDFSETDSNYKTLEGITYPLEIDPLFTGSFEDFIGISDNDYLALDPENAHELLGLFIFKSNCWINPEHLPEWAEYINHPGSEFCNPYRISKTNSRLPLKYLENKLEGGLIVMPYEYNFPHKIANLLCEFGDNESEVHDFSLKALGQISQILSSLSENDFSTGFFSFNRYIKDFTQFVDPNLISRENSIIQELKGSLCYFARSPNSIINTVYENPIFTRFNIGNCNDN
ncbi:hypothetical protein ACFLZX_06405 [Nanoarchaeota archaeon]